MKPTLALSRVRLVALAAGLAFGAAFAQAADFQIVHKFDDADPKAPTAPNGTLVMAQDGSGVGYGVTSYGGHPKGAGFGTIYAVDPQGTVTTLHKFTRAEGSNLNGPLVQTADGSLWGTAQSGGDNGGGTVYRLQPNGQFDVMYSFDTLPGEFPRAGLMLAQDGSLWGTVGYGGQGNLGGVFRIDQAGNFQVMHNFGDLPQQGTRPEGRLMQAADGSVWGTTTGTYERGASAVGGTVFRIAPDGTFSIVLDLNAGGCLQGCAPSGGLIDGHDGWYYATAEVGGRENGGTVFRVDATGAGRPAQVVHAFKGGPALDGSLPMGDLVLASNGALYGTTESGGTKDSGQGPGTIFKIDANGTYSQLHVFKCLQTGCLPHGALVETSPGVLAGTTQDDGIHPTHGGSLWTITDR